MESKKKMNRCLANKLLLCLLAFARMVTAKDSLYLKRKRPSGKSSLRGRRDLFVSDWFLGETESYWDRILESSMTSIPAGTSQKNVLFIGNSFTAGKGIGRACEQDDSNRPACENIAIPGVLFDENYPGPLDQPPDKVVDLSRPYHPVSNPHPADVPSKIKQLDGLLLSSNLQYQQNSQSAFTTRAHANQANINPHSATVRLLKATAFDAVIIQPQSTEYLNGATSTRIRALQELTEQRHADRNTIFILQQTWPRRSSREFNHLCTEGDKKGILQEINSTIAALQQQVQTPLLIAPTGQAFVNFARLACGEGIVNGCAFDETIDCPIWYGADEKISLYAESTSIEGVHQSDEIGAWLSASVLYGVIRNALDGTPCFVNEVDLAAVMPIVPNLAEIPTENNIFALISEATRLALESEYGSVADCGLIL